MTDHLAVLEELAKEMRYRAGDCYDLSPRDADSWADRITAAIALMRGQSGLSGVVRDAKFGLAMIEVDCSYFGPHMIGPRDSVRIFVEQKAPPPQDDAAQQENQK